MLSLLCTSKCMLNSKVHKKFINEFVFINHFESSQIYEHFSQHGNTVGNGEGKVVQLRKI